MEADKSSYRSIAKSTAIFGSVKIVEILVMIIRVKIVAILLGPAGIGIQSIFQSTLASINQFSSLGIFQSSVRDIARIEQTENPLDSAKIVTIVNRWSWIVGLLSVIVCLSLSGFLSSFTLKSDEYTWEFALLSLASFFWMLSNGNIAIMQGRRQLVDLAKSSLIGATISLIGILPVYWILGVKGIALALIISYLSLFVVNLYFRRRKKICKISLSLREAFNGGKDILKLGVVLMLSNLLMTLFSFLVNAFISNYGDISDIGFFQAAFIITYGNLIILISVMASDYFPRLVAVQSDKEKVNLIVNQQTELFLLIIAPVAIILAIAAPFVVRILYTEEFIVIVPMLRWMAFALFFRILWHSLSFVILAKGDKNTYLIYDAILGNGMNFLLNIVFYFLWGLYGLAISFVVGAISISLILSIVTRIKYQFKYTKKFIYLFSFLLFVYLLVYAVSLTDLTYKPIYYLFIFSSILTFSIYKLNKQIDIFAYIKSKVFK